MGHLPHQAPSRPPLGPADESPIAFYARYAADIARKVTLVAKRWRHLTRILNKVEADPNAKLYMDEALTAVADEDAEHMDLYTQNVAARTAVERERRVAAKPSHPAHPPATAGMAMGTTKTVTTITATSTKRTAPRPLRRRLEPFAQWS